MSQASKQKTASQRRNVLIRRSIIAILLIAILGFAGYRYVYLPQVVVGSLNSNIRALNDFNNQSKSNIDQLTQSTTAADFENKDSDQVKSILDQARSKNKDLQNLILSVPKKVDSLEKGPNSDTQHFRDLVAESLNKRNTVLADFYQFMLYQICLVDVANQINVNRYSNVDKINKLTSSNSNQEVSDAFNQASQDFQKNSVLIDQAKSCPGDNFKSYWKDETFALLDKDKQYYTDYAAAAKEISDGSKQSSAGQIKTGIQKINDLEAKKSNFFTTSDFTQVIDQPLNQLQDRANQADSTQAELEKYLQDIRSKYNIPNTPING